MIYRLPLIFNFILFLLFCLFEVLANQSFSMVVFANLFYLALSPTILFGIYHRFFSRFKASRLWLFLMALSLSLYFHTHLLLTIYKISRHLDFDLGFIWYNQKAFLITIYRIFGFTTLASLLFSIIALTVVFMIHYSRFEELKGKRKILSFFTVLLLLSFMANGIFFQAPLNSVVDFIHYNFLLKRKIAREYNDYYIKHIDKLMAPSPHSGDAVASPSPLKDMNVFMIQLESFNAFLVNDQITPNFLKAAKEGLYFDRYYSNTVQTTRAMDTILCGAPPGFGNSLVHAYSDEALSKLVCLPKLFNNAGYDTYFFQALELSFDHTGILAKGLGFKNRFNREITKRGDPYFRWGYREDIYYQRIFEYLEKTPHPEPIFAYISISSTNHYPFTVPPDPRFPLPFPQPKNHLEKITNTTFLQDAYLGIFLKFYEKYRENSALMVFGDHSSPIEMHKGNIACEGLGYEENFRTPLVFIPPKSKESLFKEPTRISEVSSHMGILPTFRKLLGYSKDENLLGHSFAAKLVKENSDTPTPRSDQIHILAQPFSGGFLVLLQESSKLLFNLKEDTVSQFDLSQDPFEEHPDKVNVQQAMTQLDDFFNQSSGA